MKEEDRPSKESKLKEAITLLQKNHYGCLSRVFCCKCLHCCQVHPFLSHQDLDFSLLTSENRKELFEKMIKRYLKSLRGSEEHSTIMDPFFILVALLLGESSSIYNELMQIVHGQSGSAVFSKEDMEFYIPQLCTYLVFHEEINNIELESLLVKACKVDIHFSLKYYFYMNSLSVISIGDQEVRKYERVRKYNEQFRTMINNYYKVLPSTVLGLKDPLKEK